MLDAWVCMWFEKDDVRSLKKMTQNYFNLILIHAWDYTNYTITITKYFKHICSYQANDLCKFFFIFFSDYKIKNNNHITVPAVIVLFLLTVPDLSIRDVTGTFTSLKWSLVPAIFKECCIRYLWKLYKW